MPDSLLITPDRVALVYEALRGFPPFCGWKLPSSEQVEFRTPDREDVHAECTNSDPFIITVSVRNIGHWNTLGQVLGHEMTHQSQFIAGTSTRSLHNRDWWARYRVVCRQFGWDRRAI